MKPEITQLLDDLLASLKAGDMERIGACFEPEATFRAPFLTETLVGWAAIAKHVLDLTVPHLAQMELLSVMELDNQVIRTFRSRIIDREGFEQPFEGAALYTFSPRHLIAGMQLFLDERNLRLLLLRRS